MSGPPYITNAFTFILAFKKAVYIQIYMSGLDVIVQYEAVEVVDGRLRM